MAILWRPWVGHPDGASHIPWFRVTDGRGCRTQGHPDGASTAASFDVVDGWAHPTTEIDGQLPTFEIVGSFAYVPHGAAWFHVRLDLRWGGGEFV